MQSVIERRSRRRSILGGEQETIFTDDELNALEAELLLLESMQSSRQLDPRSGALQPVSRDRPLPLSFAQQRLWFLDQLMPGNAAYHIFNSVHLGGPLVVVRVEQCFNEIIRRHESLRTTFSSGVSQPVQIIVPAMALSLPIVDLG